MSGCPGESAFHRINAFQDAEIEPRPSAQCQQRRHPRLIGPNADAIAGDARLRDLEQGADANGLVGQSFNGEILAKLSVNEVGPIQPLLPMAIGFDLVDEDSSLLTSVAAETGLAVSVQIQPADPAPPWTGFFQIAVRTVRPFHTKWRGSPTFTDSSRAIRAFAVSL